MTHNTHTHRAGNGPRRFVEKIQSVLYSQVTNGVTEHILHQVEDRETLVRTIVQVNIVQSQAASYCQLAVGHEPRGITMETIDTVMTLDTPMSKVQLLKYYGGGGPQYEVERVLIDSKGMRKLEPGDQIVLRTISTQANGNWIVGVITLFFKT